MYTTHIPPITSMYGIFTYICYKKSTIHVGNYTIPVPWIRHGSQHNSATQTSPSFGTLCRQRYSPPVLVSASRPGKAVFHKKKHRTCLKQVTPQKIGNIFQPTFFGGGEEGNYLSWRYLGPKRWPESNGLITPLEEENHLPKPSFSGLIR